MYMALDNSFNPKSLFFLFLPKNMLWYSLEMPHNLCFHGEIKKIFTLQSLSPGAIQILNASYEN